MAKVLALDYGQKRTGVAVTDDMQIIASGLKTVETKNLFEFLAEYFKKQDVESVVLGEPKQMNFEASESEVYIQKFAKLFEKKYPKIPLIRVDERFTSKMAFQTMIDSGLSKKQRQNKALVDEISATIILQSYLYNKA
jgi:putative Holliday junction resolvase|tara:strand:+ start:178 stop:591 length:414 start_codon:yes stop_codon:yes gene_type:complete